MKYLASIPKSFLAATFVLTCAVAAHAALAHVEPGTSQFIAKGTGGLKIDGKGQGVTASEAGGVLTITAPLTNLKTGMDTRDGHLKDAIDAEKYPTASLAVPRASLKFPENGKDKKIIGANAAGQFTLHGVTKELKFKYDVERQDSHYLVDGMAKIDITNFGIKEPSFMGVSVDKEVLIKVKVKLHD